MTYIAIAESIDNCISVLEEEHFSEGMLSAMQGMVCDVAKGVKALNEYVKTIDDRVAVLEA